MIPISRIFPSLVIYCLKKRVKKVKEKRLSAELIHEMLPDGRLTR